MRKLIPIWCLILAFTTTTVSAQVCQGDVVLTTQEEVNAFDCETIYGTLLITGPDITSLTPLRGLKMVDEHVILQGLPSLTSLDGLQDLTDVTCSFEIKDCDALTDLAGLGKLTSVGRNFTVINSENIRSLSGLYSLEYAQTLQVWGNPLLTECCEVAPLLDIVGENFQVYDNAPGCDLSSLQNCEVVNVCEGDIVISTQAEMDAFNCTIVIGNMVINPNYTQDPVTDLSNLIHLTEIKGNLTINQYSGTSEVFSNLKSARKLVFKRSSIYLGSLTSFESLWGFQTWRTTVSGVFPKLSGTLPYVEFGELTWLRNHLWMGQVNHIEQLRIDNVDGARLMETYQLLRNGASLSLGEIKFFNGLQHLDSLSYFELRRAYPKNFDELSGLVYADTVIIRQSPLWDDYCGLYPLLSNRDKFDVFEWRTSNDLTDVLANCRTEPISCEGDVILLTQEDFDEFNCTNIEGDLFIGSRKSPIKDLNTATLSNLIEVSGSIYIYSYDYQMEGLSNIEIIGESLDIRGNINLDSLKNLKSIGRFNAQAYLTGRLRSLSEPIRNVNIEYSIIKDSLFLSSAPEIDTLYVEWTSEDESYYSINLSPLFRKARNGSTIYADFVQSFDGLEHIDSLNSLVITRTEIDDLRGIKNLRKLNNLRVEYVNLPEDYCNFYPVLSDSSNLKNGLIWYFNSVTVTSILSECNSVSQLCEGDILISSPPDIIAFDCEVVNGNLTLDFGNLSGTNVSELGTLRALKEVTGDLIIRGVSFPIISLSDFQLLESVGGDVIIESNDYLTSIQGLSQLKYIGGDLVVRDNPRMTALGVFGLEHVTNVEITENPQLNYCCDLDLLMRKNAIQGDLLLSGNGNMCALETLADCPANPTVCDGDVYMTNQFDADYNTCEIIKGDLELFGPSALKLDSLYRLREIDGEFRLQMNNLSFDGMQNLERIGGIIRFSSYNIPTLRGTDFNLDPLVSLRSIGGFYIVIDQLYGSLNLTEPMGNVYWGYTTVIDDISWIENVPSIDTFRIDSPGNDYFGTIADRVAEGGYMDIGRVSVTDSIWKQKKYINYLRMSVETESLDFLSTLEKINTLSIGGKVTTLDICGAYNLLKNGEIGEFSGWGFQWIPPGKTEYEYLSVQYILDNCAPEVVNSLSVYPNPSGDPVVNLSWQEKGEGNTVIQVLDNNGREVIQRTTPATAGMQEAELNTTSLEPGFYLIRIISNGEVKLRRFVKQ